MKAKLLALFLGWQGVVGIVFAGAAGLGIIYKYVEHKGVKKERARVEKANDNAIKLGSGAARKSADGVRGQRDPTSRND